METGRAHCDGREGEGPGSKEGPLQDNMNKLEHLKGTGKRREEQESAEEGE